MSTTRKKAPGAGAGAAKGRRGGPAAPSVDGPALGFTARKPRPSRDVPSPPSKCSPPGTPPPPEADDPGVLGSQSSLEFAPAPPPPLKTSAQALAGCPALGGGVLVRDGPLGRGLFVGAEELPAHTVLARYGGARGTARTLPPGHVGTHTLRLAGSEATVDGRPLADALVRSPGRSTWLPPPCAAPDLKAYGALANAAATEKGANAKLVVLPDTTSVGGGDVKRALADVLPKEVRRRGRVGVCCVTHAATQAFLVAKRALAPGEEVLWRYQVRYD